MVQPGIIVLPRNGPTLGPAWDPKAWIQSTGLPRQGQPTGWEFALPLQVAGKPQEQAFIMGKPW